jgi:hypothetical protein
MHSNDLAALLRIKRARAQRAAARLALAHDAARRAEQARHQAQSVALAHDAARPAREAQIYGKLLAAPVTAAAMRAETALLSGLAAFSAVLRDQAAAATQEKAVADDHARRAARDNGAAQRATEATKALQDRHARLNAVAEDRHAEWEQEEQTLFRRSEP